MFKSISFAAVLLLFSGFYTAMADQPIEPPTPAASPATAPVVVPPQVEKIFPGAGRLIEAGPQGQAPVGQTAATSKEQTGTDLFGRGGYLHPFLLMEERWTDNLYYTNAHEKEDYITSISPGLWIAVPSNREKLLDIRTTTKASGGLQVSRVTPDITRKMQGYLSYAPEFVYYANESDNNTVNHRADGLFQLKLNSGIAVNLIDQYNHNSEPNESGVDQRLDTYDDNLAALLLMYETKGRFKFRFDVSNYTLDYEDSINDYMSRRDNTYALYTFYGLTEKTSFFVEYEFADIAYDTYTESDSTENRYYGGVQWKATEKTKGSVKIGYTEKDFDVEDARDTGAFSMEVQTQHNFTAKRALVFTGYRRFNESDMADAPAFLTTGGTAAWLQRFTEKWSGTLQVSYFGDEWEQSSRSDKVFRIAPALRLKSRDWLFFDLGYMYENRDSNDATYDYTTNTAFLKMNITL